jgi:hypothetical protein
MCEGIGGPRGMTGRLAILALLLFAALFGAALWYFQTRAFYQRLDPGALTILLTPLAGGPPEAIPARDIEAIDAPTSPLKFRACFRSPTPLATLSETYAPTAAPTPLVAPGWFDCFDAAEIADDLAAGRAVAFLGEARIATDARRVVAIYPDGRAFAWHELTEAE